MLKDIIGGIRRAMPLSASRFSLSDLTAGASAIGIAFGLKSFYIRADARDLLWILAPSSWLAQILGGIDLVYEQGAGFVSREHRLVVGPSCAGVNFLIIAFLCLYFSFAPHAPGKWRWLIYGLAISFGAAVVTNGLRIVVSAHLRSADFYQHWMTWEEVHRFAGIVIYYASLLALYFAVESGFRAQAPRLAPLCWYLGVSLGIPIVTRAYQAGTPGFSGHALWVVVVVLLITLVMALPSILRNRINCKT